MRSWRTELLSSLVLLCRQGLHGLHQFGECAVLCVEMLEDGGHFFFGFDVDLKVIVSFDAVFSVIVYDLRNEGNSGLDKRGERRVLGARRSVREVSGTSFRVTWRKRVTV